MSVGVSIINVKTKEIDHLFDCPNGYNRWFVYSNVIKEWDDFNLNGDDWIRRPKDISDAIRIVKERVGADDYWLIKCLEEMIDNSDLYFIFS